MKLKKEWVLIVIDGTCYWGARGAIEDTYQCIFCNHIFRDYKESVEEYHMEKYRAVGEEGHNMYPEAERLKFISSILQFLQPYLNSAHSALEIGSGDGLFASQVTSLVNSIVCSDIDSKMVDKCKALGFETINQDVLQLNDQKYDIVFGFDVLEHVLDIQQFKNKMITMVDDLLVLQVPVDRTMVPPNPRFDGHSHYFCQTSIVKLFEDTFAPEKIVYGHRGQFARGTELFCIFRKNK